MRQTPKTVEVLDPINLLVHALAAFGVVGALLSGPLLRFPATAAYLVGEEVNIVFLHASFAGLALIAWLAHLARVCLGWLEGGYSFSLLPRLSDIGEFVSGVRWNIVGGKRPPRGRFDYRERTSYFVLVVTLPLLIILGFMLSNPGWSAAVFGAPALVGVAELHAALGYLAAAFCAWHLYFSLCAPGALFVNASFISGKADWEKVEMMRPGWAEELLNASGAYSDEGEQEDSPPSVAELLAKGNAAATKQDYEGAKALFEEALALFPGYSQALFNLAVVLARMDKKDEAIAHLREYLAQDAFGPAAKKARTMLAELEEVKG
jgi:cytochrome b subunit of formate dehydrogenase